MGMSGRLLRPRQTIHPEAADWANRVRTNGGTVSGTTLSAVDRFVKAIHAAGIRDRFYRLNLFCGNSLAACLVPLFRNTSFGGAVLGSATDANNNFVSGDYNETVGLDTNGTVGVGTTKFLDTGLSPDAMPTLAGGHLSVFKGPGDSGAANGGLIGSRTATQVYYIRQTNTTSILGAQWGHGVLISSGGAETTRCLVLVSRVAGVGVDMYKNTSSIAFSSAGTPTSNSNSIVVFNWRETDGTVTTGNGWAHDISAYSIGAAMTSSQVSSYHSALTAFLAALGRPTS